ncbi:myelin-oligodendrocyte glycoprotein-like [Gopherus flavomarginatus]|uniref:myelin-oligodendrocyte glycoprotein-like n=1 Tax=Gopherus flavomarginatus TaxID=286002 RepID=UPI0021CBAF0F|nr:myelin-oligodendrocyte glycoprotein-like [Gopherus flavomarginatus]
MKSTLFDKEFFSSAACYPDQVTVKMKVLSFCPSSTVSPSLPGLIVFFITFPIHKLESAQFSVTGPGHPVTAIVGEAIVLPCHLSPRMSTENMEVRWFRSQFSGVVHLYHDGQDQYREQMPDYHGRTELLKDGIMDGNVSLRILNICRSDEGQYSCFIQSHAFYGEALLELKIAGKHLKDIKEWVTEIDGLQRELAWRRNIVCPDELSSLILCFQGWEVLRHLYKVTEVQILSMCQSQLLLEHFASFL